MCDNCRKYEDMIELQKMYIDRQEFLITELERSLENRDEHIEELVDIVNDLQANEKIANGVERIMTDIPTIEYHPIEGACLPFDIDNQKSWRM